jgi:dTDP-4-amino-4,6-dideoxygalactose transaminase
MDIGSSFLPSELQAAYLWAQLEAANEITERRLEIWHHYYRLLEPLEKAGMIRRPTVPAGCEQNGHLFYLLLAHGQLRDPLLEFLRSRQIQAMFHYVPLHSAPAGEKFCRVSGSLANTDLIGEQLIRLPFWNRISLEEQETVVDAISEFLLQHKTDSPRAKEFSKS